MHKLSHAVAVQDMGRSTHVWSDGYSHNKDDVADGSKSVRWRRGSNFGFEKERMKKVTPKKIRGGLIDRRGIEGTGLL